MNTETPHIFRSSQILLSRIKEDFSSYSNSGLIDEGTLYSHIKYVLAILGCYWYENKQVVLPVEFYKAKLPYEFTMLRALYKCSHKNKINAKEHYKIYSKKVDTFPLNTDTHISPDCTGRGCTNICCLKPVDCKNAERFEEFYIQSGDSVDCYNKPELMRLGNVNTNQCCESQCPNIYSKSNYTFTIKQNNIHVNFEEGFVLLDYAAFPLDEDNLPLIPDNPKLEKCIEYYIKLKIIEKLVVNKEADVANLLSYFNEQYRIALADAMYETKLPSFANMVNMVRQNRKNLNVYFRMFRN